MRRNVAAAVFLVALVACHHAPRLVDVPLRASITNVRFEGLTPSHVRSFLAFDMRITNGGDQRVIAWGCRATALDPQGRGLFTFPLPSDRIGGGVDVSQGQTVSHPVDHWGVGASPKTVAAVASYQTTCLAYAWWPEPN